MSYRRIEICSCELFDYNIICMERKELIRTIYLYLFSLIGLVITVIGLVNIVNLGLKSFIFVKADQPIIYPAYPAKPSSTPADEAAYNSAQEDAQKKQEESQRERTAADALAMIIVGLPLFVYHWKTIQKDKKS